jgi:RNA polymerase sigma-70 factor (ECF subfamily)
VKEGGLDTNAWRAIHDDGVRAFPGVAVVLARLADHARQVGAPDPALMLHGRDLFLACACTAGDAHAIAALDRVYFPPVRASLARFSARSDFVDEALQALRAKLLLGPEPRIARYAGRGPLVAWLRVAASRLAIDLLRAEDAPPAEAPVDAAPIDLDLGPEVQLLREVYRESFREALAATLGALSPEDRNLLRRHMVDHLTLQEIAVPYGVHTATIARRLTALRERVAEAVREALAARHREEGGATSLESLARAIRSEIDLSLSPLLSARSTRDAGEGEAVHGREHPTESGTPTGRRQGG